MCLCVLKSLVYLYVLPKNVCVCVCVFSSCVYRIAIYRKWAKLVGSQLWVLIDEINPQTHISFWIWQSLCQDVTLLFVSAWKTVFLNVFWCLVSFSFMSCLLVAPSHTKRSLLILSMWLRYWIRLHGILREQLIVVSRYAFFQGSILLWLFYSSSCCICCS